MGMRNRQQSLALPWKNCQVAQPESWRTSPGRGREVSFNDSHTGACVPQRFICRRASIETVIIPSEGVITPFRWAEGAHYTYLLDARCLHRQKMFNIFGTSEIFFYYWCWRWSQDTGERGEQTSAMMWKLRNLNTGGRHLRWLVVDLESVPAWQQRVVTDQVLDGRILDLRGVKVDAPIRVTQNPMASWVTLWSWEQEWQGRRQTPKWIVVQLKEEEQ